MRLPWTNTMTLRLLKLSIRIQRHVSLCLGKKAIGCKFHYLVFTLREPSLSVSLEICSAAQWMACVSPPSMIARMVYVRIPSAFLSILSRQMGWRNASTDVTALVSATILQWTLLVNMISGLWVRFVKLFINCYRFHGIWNQDGYSWRRLVFSCHYCCWFQFPIAPCVVE